MKKYYYILVLFALFLIGFSSNSIASDEHGSGIFHMARLEIDSGLGQEGIVRSWDLDSWVGGDYNKIWLKSEGEIVDNKTEQSEFWVMYSRNIAEFWDAQIGVRRDTNSPAVTYFVAGFDGLAKYLFETEAHIFISENGDITARIREENDLLITQQLILQPYAEINFSIQDIPELEIGEGIVDGEFGLQMRYEITRKFAPYIDIHYERKFGDTSSINGKSGDDTEDLIGSLGLRLMF